MLHLILIVHCYKKLLLTDRLLKEELLSLLDKQQVNQAGQLIVDYLYNNNDAKPDRLT